VPSDHAALRRYAGGQGGTKLTFDPDANKSAVRPARNSWEVRMDRRSFIVGTAAAVAAGPAFAQEAYPARAITIVNAFPRAASMIW